MASSRQLKHHARFHAAVLRNLYSSSSPPSSPKQTISSNTSEVLAEPQPQEETLVQAQATENLEEDGIIGKYEDIVAKKLYPSRAQRKRLKLKKLKESQDEPLETKKIIGPNLPDHLEKERLKYADCDFSAQGSDAAGECHSDDNKNKEVKENNSGGLAIRENNKSDGKQSAEHIEVQHCGQQLSKTKRRRLAKKNWSNQTDRSHLKGSTFTAEIKGKNIIIQQMD